MVQDSKLGFMRYKPHLLAGLSRAGDALVIITNQEGIGAKELKRRRQIYDRLKTMLSPSCITRYEEDLPDLGIAHHQIAVHTNRKANDAKETVDGVDGVDDWGMPTDGGFAENASKFGDGDTGTDSSEDNDPTGGVVLSAGTWDNSVAGSNIETDSSWDNAVAEDNSEYWS